MLACTLEELGWLCKAPVDPVDHAMVHAPQVTQLSNGHVPVDCTDTVFQERYRLASGRTTISGRPPPPFAAHPGRPNEHAPLEGVLSHRRACMARSGCRCRGRAWGRGTVVVVIRGGQVRWERLCGAGGAPPLRPAAPRPAGTYLRSTFEAPIPPEALAMLAVASVSRLERFEQRWGVRAPVAPMGPGVLVQPPPGPRPGARHDRRHVSGATLQGDLAPDVRGPGTRRDRRAPAPGRRPPGGRDRGGRDRGERVGEIAGEAGHPGDGESRSWTICTGSRRRRTWAMRSDTRRARPGEPRGARSPSWWRRRRPRSYRVLPEDRQRRRGKRGCTASGRDRAHRAGRSARRTPDRSRQAAGSVAGRAEFQPLKVTQRSTGSIPPLVRLAAAGQHVATVATLTCRCSGARPPITSRSCSRTSW